MKSEKLIGRNRLERAWNDTVLERFGILICKPDAVKLGIAESLVAEVAKILHDQHEIPFPILCADYLKQSSANPDLLGTIYPHQIEDLRLNCPDLARRMAHHLKSGPMMGAIFSGDGKAEVTSLLKIIRGKRIDRVDFNSESQCEEFGRSIRGLVPVPGTSRTLAEAIERLRSGSTKYPEDMSMLTRRQREVVTQNLVHVPDTVTEFEAALSLFPRAALHYALPRMRKVLSQ